MQDPHPGAHDSRRRTRLLALLVVVLIGIVAVMQQTASSAASRAVGQPAGAPGGPGVLPPRPELEITARVFTKVYFAFGRDPALAGTAVRSLDDASVADADRLRVAIVAGALMGAERAAERLDELDGGEDLQVIEDAATVRALLAGEPVDEDAREGLIKRHGWFGRLAATHGKDPDDPARASVIGGGERILAFGLVVMLGGFGALLTGFVLLLIGLVRGASGTLRVRFHAPPDSLLLLETVAVFVAGFIALKFAAAGVAAVAGEQAGVWFALTGQWSLALLILWPCFRGLSVRRTLHEIGLHKGRGVAREMVAGVVGYLACLPLFLAGVVVSLVLVLLYQVVRLAMGLGEPAVPQNPILEIVTESKGSWMIVLLFLLASLWAPLVEESIFRGALYGHLRRGWHWLPAGLVTALGFSLMHGYPMLMLGGVMALGFGFALLREWRGSLIAPMTAHCLHNATMLGLLLTAMRLL